MNTRRFDLTGRVAIVTGGAGILGRAVCRGLAEHGASVVLVDVDGASAAARAEEISADTDNTCVSIECDVADPESVRTMVDSVLSRFGRIDILHNNAATKTKDVKAFLAPAEDYAIETWREVMSVNLDGMFIVAQAVGKWMLDNKHAGSIIQTSSIYGLCGPDPNLYEGSEYLGNPISTPPSYAASKAAIIGLSRHLATTWGRRGIRVNTLVPGGVESGQNDAFQQRYSARTPMGRMAVPDDLVGMVVFLASDASGYVTGQTIAVDGGWTAW